MNSTVFFTIHMVIWGKFKKFHSETQTQELTSLLCPWGFSRQTYWSGLPFPLPGDLPNPEIKLGSQHCGQFLYQLSS